MRVTSIRVDKLMVLFAIVLLFLLESIYLNNAITYRQYNTGVIQIILLALSGTFAVFFLKTKKVTLVVSGLLLSLIMFISSISNPGSEQISILSIVSKCFLWFFVFLLGYVSTRFFNCENIVPQIAAIVCAVFVGIILSNREFDLQTYKKDTVVTSVYYLLCCAPFVLCMKRKRIRNIILIIIVLICFFSFKRSALLVTGAAVLLLLIINNNRSRKLKFYVLGVVIVVTIATFLYVVISSGNDSIVRAFELWKMRFSGGNDSRVHIWKNVIDLMENSNLSQTLFGHGYNAVMKDTVSRLSAHNDYLEIMYNYGFIAIVLFIAFVLSLIKNCKSLATINWSVYNGYVCALVIFLVASIPSHMLTYSTYFMILSFYFGYANGIEEKEVEKQLETSSISTN